MASFELGEIRPSRYFFGLAGALGVLLGLVTRGDLTGVNLLLHFLQWQFQAYTAMVILIGTHLLLLRWRFFQRQLGEWWQLLLGGFLGALVFSLPALALDLLFRVDPMPEHASDVLRLWWGELGGVLAPVTLTWLTANAPWVVGFRMVQPSSLREPVRSHTSVPDAPAQNTGFLNLIDGTDPREICYLKAELQYIRIVTTSREHLVLYSLRDAVAELPPSFGVQTHRSYWVLADKSSLSTGCSGRDKNLIYGRLLVYDDSTVYGYARKNVHWSNQFQDAPYHLFARRRDASEPAWSQTIPIRGKGSTATPPFSRRA